jgi:hypothetical protein
MLMKSTYNFDHGYDIKTCIVKVARTDLTVNLIHQRNLLIQFLQNHKPCKLDAIRDETMITRNDMNFMKISFMSSARSFSVSKP